MADSGSGSGSGSSPMVTLVKTLFVPAVISLILFLFLNFAVLPIWRRYRNRYSQYLPVESISQHTSTLRHRIMHRLSSLTLPSTWSRNRGAVDNAMVDDELDLGEELGDFDAETFRVVDRHPIPPAPDNARRLSRDLEEGFMDDSDEDEPSHR